MHYLMIAALTFSTLALSEINPDPKLLPFEKLDADPSRTEVTCPNFTGQWVGGSDEETDQKQFLTAYQEQQAWEAKCSRVTLLGWRNGTTFHIGGHNEVSYAGIHANNPQTRYFFQHTTTSKWVDNKLEALTHYNYYMTDGAVPAGGGTWTETIWIDEKEQLRIIYKSGDTEAKYTFKRVKEEE